MNNTSKILVAFAAGAAVGAALGILFAPNKGSETRDQISQKGKKIFDEFGKKVKEGKEKFNEMKDFMKETNSEASNA